MNNNSYFLYRTTEGLFFCTTNLVFRIEGLRTPSAVVADRSLRVRLAVSALADMKPPYFIRTVNLLNKKACETFVDEYRRERWLEASVMLTNLERLAEALQEERQRIRTRREIRNYAKALKNRNTITTTGSSKEVNP